MELKEQFEALTVKLQGESKEQREKAFNEFEAKFKDAVKNEVKEVKESLTADFEAKNKVMQDHLDALDIKSQNKGGMNKKENALTEEIKSRKDELVKGLTDFKELEVKAVSNRASITNTLSRYELPEINQLGTTVRSLYNVLPKITIPAGNDGGSIEYTEWDEDTTVRAADMVAEEGTFPQSTAKFTTSTLKIQKVGDSLPVTEEFYEDESRAAAELEQFLMINVDLKVDNALINDTGAGNTIKGLLASSKVYTPVASGISGANLKDLVIKMRNSITRTRGSKFNPDMVVVSSSTMEGLVLAKDDNNNYIFDENTGTLGGLAVVVDEQMPDNSIVVGDRRFATIYEKAGFTMKKDAVNNQFLEDIETIKVRKRLALLIKNYDEYGFAKVTDVAGALNTLSSIPV